MGAAPLPQCLAAEVAKKAGGAARAWSLQGGVHRKQSAKAVPDAPLTMSAPRLNSGPRA